MTKKAGIKKLDIKKLDFKKREIKKPDIQKHDFKKPKSKNHQETGFHYRGCVRQTIMPFKIMKCQL